MKTISAIEFIKLELLLHDDALFITKDADGTITTFPESPQISLYHNWWDRGMSICSQHDRLDIIEFRDVHWEDCLIEFDKHGNIIIRD